MGSWRVGVHSSAREASDLCLTCGLWWTSGSWPEQSAHEPKFSTRVTSLVVTDTSCSLRWRPVVETRRSMCEVRMRHESVGVAVWSW